MSSTGCPGFRAHTINPTRCRRCFKDASEHGDAPGGKDADADNNSSTGTPRTRRTPSFTGDTPTAAASAQKDSLGSAASASFGGGLRTTRSPSSSFSRADALPTLGESTTTTMSSSSSPSATFTVKQKRVKFVDGDGGSDNVSSGGADSNNNKSSKAAAAYNVELKSPRETEPVNVEFTISMKKPRASVSEGASSRGGGGGGTSEDYQSRIKELSQELSKAKEKIDVLEAKNKEVESMRKSFSKAEGGRESIKANFDENAKLKAKIDDLEATVRTLKADKQRQTKTTQSDSAQVAELRAKLEKSEKLVSQLTAENEDIKKDVKSLEVEFQELHDNFREDHTSEFRVVKRELEAMSKNCRVMQFKLKKAERTIEQLENEKIDLTKNVSELYETAKMDVDKRRMKELENELAIAKEVSLKLHAEIETLKEERMIAVEQMQELQRQQSNQSGQQRPNHNNSGGVQRLSSTTAAKLSPTPSFDQTTKDYEQVVRDLYDCMEREKDLQEQLRFAEEETRTTRKKLSTMEQENEILMMQIRKMASTKNAKVGEDDDSDELNPEELKLHLELYEQEMVVLRRKCDELEQENDNFTQEIKYLQEKLVSQPTLARVEMPELPAGSPPNVIYEHKIRLLEAETRELRKKLVDKEKENESLRTEVELHRRRASKVITRSRSLDNEGQSLDMKKQLALFEQEAAILRQKLMALEADNEKLVGENKRLQLRISKKPPPGPADQLQLENLELKERVKEYERKCDSLKTDLMNAKLNETTETETDFIANLKKQLRAKEADLASLSTKAAEADVECARLNREYKKLKDSLVPRRRVSRVIRETATRMELKEIIKEMEDEVAELQTINRGRDSVIENLTEEISELKREYQELEVRAKNGSAGNGASGKSSSKVEELRKKLQDEQHRVKSLEARLEALSREKNVDLSLMDSLEVLQGEKKEMAIRLEELTGELEKAKRRTKDLSGKLDVHTRNKDDLAGMNVKLRDNLEKVEDELEELAGKLKASEAGGAELKKMCEEMRKELERVANLNVQLKKESDEQRSKLAAINSRSGGVSEQSALLQKEAADLKRKLEESRRSVEALQRQADAAKGELKEREAKWKEELKEQLEATSKKVRREVHLELQTLREESTTYRNRCQELVGRLDQAEREVKEAAEKLKANVAAMRKEREELTDRIHSLESAAKGEQRKREKLEREVESATRGKEEELLQAQDRLVTMEREARRLTARLEDVEYEYQGKVAVAEREAAKLRGDYEELTGKYDLLEKDFVALKSRAVAEKETLVETVGALKRSYEEKMAEIRSLKEASMSHQKEWFKEKLHYQERIAAFEAKANKAKLVEEERDRLKVLVADKENLLNSYRKEERAHNEERERNRVRTDELTGRLAELERVERNTRFLSITGRAQVDKELADYRIRLEHSETSHKGELAALHAEYEGRMRLLGDEVEHMQRQIAGLALERDQLRDSLEKTTREMVSRGTMRGTLKDEVEDLGAQLRTLRSDLEGALLENRNLKIQHGTERSSWAIQVAEYKTQINQLEERILLETRGTTRNYARTKMELAWEKERTENHRLLQETQRFIQELRDKLVGTEALREKEREEARKQLVELKTGMDREQGGTQAKIAELHFDLLALKEAHVRLKSQNERLRRERATLEKSKVDFVGEELAALQKVLDSKAAKSLAGKEVAGEVAALQKKLSTRLEELIAEASARGVSSSDLSIASRVNGRGGGGGTSGSLTSINSTTLPPPSAVKRAPPRTKSLGKKSLSLDQQLGRASIERQIWGTGGADSDANTSLNTTPNSSVSNLRFGGAGGVRYGYTGYDSDSSGSSFFGPGGQLRLKSGGTFAKEGSFAGGSESDTSAASGVPGGKTKTSLKEKFRIRRSSKTSDPGTTGGAVTDTEDKQTKLLKQKLTLAGFEMSPLEMAKQREKKEKSLRYKISKTLSKTFSRSTSVLDGGESSAGAAERSKSPKRTKSPSRTKSPTRQREEAEKSTKPEPAKTTATFSSSTPLQSTTTSRSYSSSRHSTTSMIGSITPRSYEPISTYRSSLTVSGLAQLRQPPTVSKSNLAVPPSVRPKVRLRTETNV